jgi:hypothetical protein
MKKLKSFKEQQNKYVAVNASGRVELRLTSSNVPVAVFGNDAVYALLMGDVIQVNLKGGKTVFYKLGGSGNTVSGPYFSL